MIIKKYIGKTEEEAAAQARAELGENIVIMNVRNAPKKGLFGFLKKPQIEVTVAKEEENDRYPYAAAKNQEEAYIRDTFRQVAIAAGTASAGGEAAKTGAPPDGANTARRNGAGANAVRTNGVGDSDAAKGQTASAFGFEPFLLDRASEQGSPGSAKSIPEREETPADSQQILVEKIDSLQNMIEKQFQAAGDESGKGQPEDRAEQENSEMVRFMKLLYNTMLENEVGESYANQLVAEVEKNAKPNMPFDYALSEIYQKMVLKFGKSVPIERGGKKPRVVFFVGPTGVGKTTTIAKIASKFRVDYGMKVALVTADTYRIAAAEQLRTYANILEIPFRVIYAVEEMEMALRDFSAYDFILVDTAGHSCQNTPQKENMTAFIHSAEGKAETEVHLVLAATTKYRDLVNIADTYSDIADYKLIFTKLDETAAYGNVLNIKLYTGANLSYAAFGQNVPDDIEVFNPQKAVKQLLGGGRKKDVRSG